MGKTKAELLEEIEQKNGEIAKLKSEIKGLEKLEKNKNAAAELKALYDGYVEAGFRDNQAFELVHTMFKCNKAKEVILRR